MTLGPQPTGRWRVPNQRRNRSLPLQREWLCRGEARETWKCARRRRATPCEARMAARRRIASRTQIGAAGWWYRQGCNHTHGRLGSRRQSGWRSLTQLPERTAMTRRRGKAAEGKNARATHASLRATPEAATYSTSARVRVSNARRRGRRKPARLEMPAGRRSLASGRRSGAVWRPGRATALIGRQQHREKGNLIMMLRPDDGQSGGGRGRTTWRPGSRRQRRARCRRAAARARHSLNTERSI